MMSDSVCVAKSDRKLLAKQLTERTVKQATGSVSLPAPQTSVERCRDDLFL